MSVAVPPPRAAAGPLVVDRLTRIEGGERLGSLLWRAGPGWRMISSAVLGGGLGERSWVLNAQVAHGYLRTDPDAHLAELADTAGALGPGVGLMTAADVSAYGRGHDGGVDAVATAGLRVRGWAAAPSSSPAPSSNPAANAAAATATPPGTINVIVALPVALTDAALVNAVATATEAKVQALLSAGYDCSGTPTDAVCIAVRTPRDGAEVHPFAGPRSLWGARLARAVYEAVRTSVPAPCPPGAADLRSPASAG
ncbi:adenosylcobinamide amidohydrolase [Streptomyces sp. NPDC020412]|uniref:adenosylcobinamide amidohydrolase n=1 Tax=Streptomyces sp. NPDC020412 TaxID=3365073 RepID=UPI00379C2CF7